MRRTTQPTRASAHVRSRPGFSLVELLVATMMLTVGVLGLASTSAVVSRMMAGGTMQTVAATMAQSRFELLRSTRCVNIASDSATARGVSEKWTASSAGTRVFDIVDTLRFATTRGTSTQTYRSLVRC